MVPLLRKKKGWNREKTFFNHSQIWEFELYVLWNLSLTCLCSSCSCRNMKFKACFMLILQNYVWLIANISQQFTVNTRLVGGFNPSEKYESNWVHLPQFSGWKLKEYLKPPPSRLSIYSYDLVLFRRDSCSKSERIRSRPSWRISSTYLLMEKNPADHLGWC